MELSERIRPKSHGIGQGRFWEYKDNRNFWTVAPSKDEAVRRALLNMPTMEQETPEPDRFFDPTENDTLFIGE